MKFTPLWPGKVCAIAVTSLNQASYRLSDPALTVWRMTEVTAAGSRRISATFASALISSLLTLRFLRALIHRSVAARHREDPLNAPEAKVSSSGSSASASDWRLREGRVGDRRSGNRSREPCIEGQVRDQG